MTDVVEFLEIGDLYPYAYLMLDNLMKEGWIKESNFDHKDWIIESQHEVFRQYCVDQVSGTSKESIINLLEDNYGKYKKYIDQVSRDLFGWKGGDVFDFMRSRLGKYDTEDAFADVCAAIDDDTGFASTELDIAYRDFKSDFEN